MSDFILKEFIRGASGPIPKRGIWEFRMPRPVVYNPFDSPRGL
jgi:hypothetical protein